MSCKEKEQGKTTAKEILENSEINSVSVGICKDGKTYTKYYREIDKGKGNRPNDNSPVVGPEILAAILEKVYSELLDKYILKEAQMEHTAIHIKTDDEKNMVNGYSDDGKLIKPLPVTG